MKTRFQIQAGLLYILQFPWITNIEALYYLLIAKFHTMIQNRVGIIKLIMILFVNY